MVRVERYQRGMAAEWDEFVRASRNGTFLFQREYMDHHSDRFADHSLLVRNDEGAILGMLPAHASGDQIASHNGLSYGGLVVGPRLKTPQFLRAFEALLLHIRETGFAALDYKTIPHLYHRQPAEDDRYALFLLDAALTRRDLLSVVALDDRLPYQLRRERGIKKANRLCVQVRAETDFREFWSLLVTTLAERFAASPVHTVDEITLLRNRFPLNIRLHTVRSATGELLAGVVTYLSDCVVHCQYIATSVAGRESCALDLVFDHLLHDVSHDCSYFDFGGSHEESGRIINEGLIDQKEGFGARSVTHDHYRIDLRLLRPGVLTEALR